MLPPFIIEQIRQREREKSRKHRPQPQLELPLPPKRRAIPEHEDDSERGVVVIDLGK